MAIDMLKAAAPSSALRARSSVLVIEPRALTRGCVAQVLKSEFPEHAIVEIVAFDAQTLAPLAAPGLIVLGLQRGERADDELALRLDQLREAFPDTPIALMGDDDDHCLAAAIVHGCSGYLPTSLPLAVAVAALRLVMVGGSYFPQFPQRDRVGLPATATLSPKAEASAPIALPPTFVLDGEPPRRTAGREQTSPASCFTPREQQVVAALQRGLSNKIIAADLGMSENTVKVHVRHVMRKLRASNRTQAALMCRAQLEGDGLEAASA